MSQTVPHRRFWLPLLVAMAAMAAACGGAATTAEEPESGATAGDATDAAATAADSPAEGTEAPAGEGELTVGMALAGPQNDKGFAQAHYEGLLLVEEQLGAEVAVLENVLDPQARVEALRTLAQDNEMVIGAGAEYAEAGTVVAPQFPDVTFAIVNGEPSDAPNLHVYFLREGVPAYIAGVVAGHLAGSDTAGFVGGEEIPPLFQARDGFQAGLHSVEPSIELNDTIVGSFIDVQGAYAAASSQIASGADVIYSYVDSGIVGVIEAIVDSGEDVVTFGIIFPRCGDFPQIVGTSVINASQNVLSIVEDYVNGNLSDEPIFRGVENSDIVRFELCPEWDRPDLQQLVEETTQAIIDGEVELPEGV